MKNSVLVPLLSLFFPSFFCVFFCCLFVCVWFYLCFPLLFLTLVHSFTASLHLSLPHLPPPFHPRSAHPWSFPCESRGWGSFVEEWQCGWWKEGILEELAPLQTCPLQLVVTLPLEPTHSLWHTEGERENEETGIEREKDGDWERRGGEQRRECLLISVVRTWCYKVLSFYWCL